MGSLSGVSSVSSVSVFATKKKGLLENLKNEITHATQGFKYH